MVFLHQKFVLYDIIITARYVAIYIHTFHDVAVVGADGLGQLVL